MRDSHNETYFFNRECGRSQREVPAAPAFLLPLGWRVRAPLAPGGRPLFSHGKEVSHELPPNYVSLPVLPAVPLALCWQTLEDAGGVTYYLCASTSVSQYELPAAPAYVLPLGWRVDVAPNGAPYFLRGAETSWDLPVGYVALPEPAVMAHDLAVYWETRTDPATGRVRYFQECSGCTLRAFPCAPVLPRAITLRGRDPHTERVYLLQVDSERERPHPLAPPRGKLPVVLPPPWYAAAADGGKVFFARDDGSGVSSWEPPPGAATCADAAGARARAEEALAAEAERDREHERARAEAEAAGRAAVEAAEAEGRAAAKTRARAARAAEEERRRAEGAAAAGAGAEALPPGWLKMGPNAKGRFWYDHPESAHTQWEPPGGGKARTAASGGGERAPHPKAGSEGASR
jgi:hypothetical protein